MTDAIALALALSPALGGFAVLSLTMSRHQDALTGTTLSPTSIRGLRAAASILLCLALTACIWHWGGPIGVVAWLGILTAAAQSLVLVLRYLPRLVLHLTWALPLSGMLIWCIAH
jgi:hypothetical protein